MVNSVGLLGLSLTEAAKAIKKLPYGPIRVVYCGKQVNNKVINNLATLKVTYLTTLSHSGLHFAPINVYFPPRTALI